VGANDEAAKVGEDHFGTEPPQLGHQPQKHLRREG
jgi:hypothetical protein